MRRYDRHSRQVGRTKRWQVLRWEILERDKFACVKCGARGRLEVDHVQPVRTHPELSFEPDNLQSLCAGCHTRKTRLECGHPPASPERVAWRKAVADIAAKPNKLKGNSYA